MTKHDLAGALADPSRRHSLSRRRGALMVSVALMALGIARPAFSQAADALPTGGSVIGGAASFSTPTVGTLQVGQTTDRALIEWSSFDIGSNATVNFVQPSASAVALNRVVGGGAPSQIAGHLNSNGIVAIINSNGVAFAGTADVNVGGLIASTADIGNSSFMSGGALNFNSSPSSSEIVVQAGAQISIADQGLAVLFAPVVRNQGLINARLGHVTLAAGASATLDLDGTGFLEIGIGNDNALVENSGTISANGGNILMTAQSFSAVIDQVINTGTLSVGSASLDGSEIVLEAAGGNARIGGFATGKLAVTASSDVQVASNLNVDSGSATLTGQRVYGAGDVNVAGGDLTLNVNPTGVAGVTVSGSRINGALDVIGSVSGAATVNIGPGEYTEAANGVGTYGGVGGQNFGLFVFKDNVTLRGVDASGNVITNADNVVAYVRSANETGFGAQNFVSGSGVTIEGLGFRPRTAVSGFKTLEVNGNAFTLRNSVIDNRGNPTEVNFYISDFDNLAKPRVESFTLQNNVFYGGTTASTMVLVAGGTGRTTDATNRIFSGNRIIGSSLVGQSGFRIEGQATATAPWAVLTTGPVTITNNSFDNVDAPIRTLGVLTQGLDWNAVFRNNGNSFLDGAVLAYDGSSLNARGAPNAGGDLDFRITSRISDSVARALAGDTVRMLDGTYSLGSSQLVLSRSITLLGQSQSGTIIDGRAASGNGLGTISVFADNTTLGNFTLYGSEVAGGNYGIKVQPNPAGHVNTPGGDDQRINNIAISDVTVRGSRRAELDINGAVGVTVTNFTADGRRVANAAATEGAGIQITDSANVTLSGTHTLGNVWGGVALYQSNKASAYDGQTTNINIDASQNIFEESLGLFTQLESTTQGFGQLNLTGFNYAVRNLDHRLDDLDDQFTFFRTSLTDATNFALSVGTPSSSSIESYTGTAFTNIFSVSNGLSINAALRDARAGGVVNVGAGTYAETVAITKNLTLAGAGKTGTNATSITGGITITGSPAGLVLSDFAVSGSGNGTSVIGNTGTLTGLTMSGVRIDGGNVADRHGFIGGQIGGDIAITGSDFVNIRGWAAFDTRSGAGGNDGAQISSAIFSNNLIDNTVGGIAFRQQIGAATLPDVTISGNTVRNVGNATNSFGAIFKAFNAGTVNFTGNSVSDIGTSGFAPTGEAAYGAALMARGVSTLNVSGNTFTNNNQVFAVEPNRGLAAVTNFSNNSFVNNAYSIYLPTSLAGANTINFGAGNNFISGARTVQHIVWRSSADLDLTNVRFNGALAGTLDMNGKFALADLITDGLDRNGAGLARLVSGNIYVTAGSGNDGALRAATLSQAGDTINLSAGTHTLTDTLFLQKNGVSVLGQGQGATTIDASGHNNYGIRVKGDGVTLSGFTLNGSSAAVGNANYGIKVEKAGDVDTRNAGFTIRNVAINGSRRHGLDINAAVGALIDGVSVSGVTNGNGIAISDSANVTVRNSSTTGNAWGGLALYQTNNLAGGGTNQQLTGITIEGNNNFGEAAGLYLQDSSALLNPGTLSIQGYGFTVRNSTHRSDGAQFTFFEKTAQSAFDYAVNLGTPADSVVQGWNGSANSADFYVGQGTQTGVGSVALSLQTALGASGDGAAINVASGTYAESASVSGARTINLGDVTLNSLTLSGGGSLKGQLTLTGSFTSNAPLTLTGNTSIGTLAGDIVVAGLSGNAALTLSGNTVNLGQASLGSLTVTGTTIATTGVTTSGAQSYTGATTLSGTYSTGGGSFAVNGASTLNSTTAVATGGGNASFRTIGGANGLGVNAGTGNVTFGAVNGLSALTASGSTISTSGATTSGNQTYTGATTLRGTYTTSGGSFAVNGAATLGSATTVATGGGNASFGGVGGANSLSVNAGSGNVALGGANGLTSLTANGASITTAGAVTSGTQSYTGATTLGGTYNTGGGAFAVNGSTTLGSATAITTDGGNASFASIDAALAGGQALTVDAGSGVATLGAMGARTRVGAVSVNARQVILNGANNAANSFRFTGAAGATVQLTQASTAFDTTLPGNGGGAITIEPNLIGTVNGQQNVSFIAGSGLTADSGDVAIGNVGTDAIRLGTLTVAAHNFSAATVKLASDFKSLLSGSQVFTSNTLDTLGNVLADVLGNESGPIRAGGSVEMKSGGAGTGSIIAGGPVQLNYTSDVIREVSSQSSVSVASSGAVGGSINATGVVAVNAVGPVSSSVTTGSAVDIASLGEVSGAINAGGAVGVQATGPVRSSVTSSSGVTIASQGAVSGAINASGAVDVKAVGEVSSAVKTSGAASIASAAGVSSNVNAGAGVNVVATNGNISGSITATGPVNVNASKGSIGSSISTSGNASLTSGTGSISSTINAGGSVAVTAPGAVTSTITSGGSISLSSNTPVAVQVNGGSVSVNAPGGKVAGVFGEIKTGDGGSFVVNEQSVVGDGKVNARQIIIDSFLQPTGSLSGEILLPSNSSLGLTPSDGAAPGQRPLIGSTVEDLGALLGQGYSAMMIQIDESSQDAEDEGSD